MNKLFVNMKITIISKTLLNFLKGSAVLPYLCILIVLSTTFRIYPSGDDQNLLNGLSSAFSCFASFPVKFPCGASHFPIFQYLIATPFKLAGFGDPSLIEVFGLINLGWSFIAAAAFWRVGFISAARPGGHLAVLVLLSGYLLWYMTSSFNEAGAFALFALLALSIIDNWRIGFVCLVAFGCTITKEVAFPFVLYFMFLSLLAREVRHGGDLAIFRRIPQFFSEYKFAIASVFAGVLLNHSFNYFRFGSIANLSNLDPVLFNPWEYVPVFLMYIFISPAGGLVFSWLSLIVLFIAQAVFLVRDRSIILISALTFLGLIAANFGLARWYSCFGWNAWGPRLTLPFLGAVGILGIYLVMPQIIKYFRRVKYGAVMIFIVIAASSLPNFAARLDGGAFFSQMFAPTKVAIDSGIPSFTIQSAPVPLYQKAAIEGYSRNIIVPTTVEMVLKNVVITLLWLIPIFYICNRFIIVPDQNERKANRFGAVQKTAYLLSAIFLVIAFAFITRSHRESCPKCFDFWQKLSLGEIKSEYYLSGPQAALVKGLDGFPATLPLATISLELPHSATLKAIFVGAIGHKGADAGNWTTQPISHLWGIGIVDNKTNSSLVNDGARKEELNLPIDHKLTLLIPDNGNLSICPDLYVKLFFMDGKRASTLASCARGKL